MPSYTTWSRLTPRTRNRQLTETLRAELHDPLWLLGRQWQLGEFIGEDAGSPVKTKLDLTVDHMTSYRPKDDNIRTQEYDPRRPGAPPLEGLVERELIRLPLEAENRDIRRAADFGGHFLRMLSASNAALDFDPADFADVGPFPQVGVDDLLIDVEAADYQGDAEFFARIVSGRLLDGDRLYGVFSKYLKGNISTLPAPPDIPTDPSDPKFKAYENTIKAYCTRYKALYAQSETNKTAWDEDRLEYRFAVGMGPKEEQTVLEASEYNGDGLDWPDFSVRPGESLEIADNADVQSHPQDSPTLYPTPSVARFPGMPVSRWWEFEDGRVNIDALDASPEDLSRLLFMQFALLYGNDWFNIPIDLSIGTLTRIDCLKVTDTFGQTTEIDTASGLSDHDADTWNMFAFTVNDSDGEDAALFLPPVLARSLESNRVEEVHFIRDEMVNIGWALETLVEGPIGLPLDRHERDQQVDKEGSAVPTSRNTTADRQYRIATGVPDYWIPLLPEGDGTGAIKLRLGDMIDVADVTKSDVKGRILATPQIEIPEEEIPRQGSRVERAYQFARWVDGSTHLWSGRKRLSGAGEGRGGSGLRFDTAEVPPPEDSSPKPAAEMSELSRRTADLPTNRTAPLSISEVHTLTDSVSDPNDEWIAVRNVAEVSIDLTGWRIEDGTGHRYSFPNGFRLDPSARVVLYSGTGTDGPMELYWGETEPFLGTTGVLFAYHLESLMTRRPYPAPTQIPKQSSIVIGEINATIEPSGSLNGEYITIFNSGEQSINIGEWRVQNEEGLTYSFPSNFVLEPHEITRLRSGSGTDSGQDLFWGLTDEAWEDTGGVITLLDNSGDLRARSDY